MYLVGTSGSPTQIASQAGDEPFVPVYGETVSSEFLWDLLKSFYRQYLPDREIVTAFWDAVMAVAAGQVQHLWHLEFARSLRDVPVYSGHKWVQFDFARTDAFTNESLDKAAPFVRASDVITGTWEVGRNVQRAVVPLRGSVTEACSLSWEVNVQLGALVQPRSSLWFGYQGTSTRLRNALLVGLFSQAGGGDLVLALMHSTNLASADYVCGNVVLDPASSYRLAATYSAATRRLRGEVWDRRKLLWTGNVTGSASENALTNQVSATSSLEASVRAGDVVVLGDSEFEVVSVDGANVVLRTYGFYAGSTQEVSFYGERLADVVHMDLLAESANPDFTATQFGTCTADLRLINQSLVAQPLRCAGRRLAASTWGWKYTDPTAEIDLLSVPRLTDLVESPTIELEEGVDYVLVDNQFRFQEPPTGPLWAENIAVDDSLVSSVYGSRVGLTDRSSEAFKLKVQGLFYVYYRGPTVGALRTGAHMLFGLPISMAPGTVEVVNETFSGTHGLLTISGTDYLYPRSVGTDLQVGDTVDAFEPLSNGVEILTWQKQPHWWVGLADFNEIQKYHSFGLRADLAAVDLSGLDDIRTFLRQAVPPSKSPRIILYRSLFDRIQPSDLLTFRSTISLFDTLSSAVPLVRYDSQDAEGEGAGYDWLYDGSTEPWTAAAPGVAINTSVDLGLLDIVESSSTATGSGLATALGGTGSKVRTYVLLYTYLSGLGARLEGENTLTTETAEFVDVAVGGRIWIGTDQYQIQEVVDDYTLVLDREAFVSETVAWAYEGPSPVWAQVDSVTSESELEFDTAAAIASGTYSARLVLGAALDVRYDEFTTVSPDEDLTISATLSRGFGLTLLSGYSTLYLSSTAVGGQATGQPGDTAYTSEIGTGSVSNKWVLSGTGRWYRVSSVTNSHALVLASTAPVAEVDTLLWLNPVAPLNGTFTFTNGSGTVTASTSQSGAISAGDWIQVLAAANANEDPFSVYPVVQVASVSGGTTLTLYEPYTGKSVAGSTVLKRGTTTALPQDVDLPVSTTSTSTFSLTGWYGAAGDTASATVEEP